MVKISKDLEWLRPYYILAAACVPKVLQIRSIKISYVQRGKMVRQLGSLTSYPSGLFRMTLYTSYRKVLRLKPEPFCTIKKLSRVNILRTFAHELSHVENWKHTPSHVILEAKLCIIFMSELLCDGYVSEEEEMKDEKGTVERVV